MKSLLALIFGLLSTSALPALAIHHQLKVQLTPALHQISGEDTISELPGEQLEVTLHKSLQVSFLNAKVLQKQDPTGEIATHYFLQLESEARELRVRFSGVIFDPVQNEFSSGLIAAEGAGLFGGSAWYPNIEGQSLTFEMIVSGPQEWQFISQGEPTPTGWRCDQPQEEIFLMAGPFQRFQLQKDHRTYSVYLRNDQKQADASLAQKFLDLTPGYIEHYSQMIAPYPYPQFSVVENFWETGFGMPSFTLLGSSVIRLPFIFTSSYPHEILHNWWGNSVYVDSASGNWSEGLTTYMGDHWQQELIQQDDQYRLTALLNFSSYVNSGADFPLREFRGRHNQSSQAVGYGKSMMLFHMLRTQFGKAQFEASLRDFYVNNQYRAARFTDIQKSFEKITGQSLKTFFHQWLDQTGAPRIALDSAVLDNPTDLQFQISQKQTARYELTIPVQISLASGKSIEIQVHLSGSVLTTHLQLPEPAKKITVDPHYDVFRELYLEEKPAILSQVTGASQLVASLKDGDSESETFLKTWESQLEGQITRRKYSVNQPLPKDQPLLILGDLGPFTDLFLKSAQNYDIKIKNDTIALGSQTFSLQSSAFVISVRSSQNLAQTITWIHWPSNTPVAEWASRLLHYGKYSALVFTGKPNVFKNTWTSKNSPLSKDF